MGLDFISGEERQRNLKGFGAQGKVLIARFRNDTDTVGRIRIEGGAIVAKIDLGTTADRPCPEVEPRGITAIRRAERVAPLEFPENTVGLFIHVEVPVERDDGCAAIARVCKRWWRRLDRRFAMSTLPPAGEMAPIRHVGDHGPRGMRASPAHAGDTGRRALPAGSGSALEEVGDGVFVAEADLRVGRGGQGVGGFGVAVAFPVTVAAASAPLAPQAAFAVFGVACGRGRCG